MADLIIVVIALWLIISLSVIYIIHVRSIPSPKEQKKNWVRIALVIAMTLLISMIAIITYLEKSRSEDLLIEHQWKGEANG